MHGKSARRRFFEVHGLLTTARWWYHFRNSVSVGRSAIRVQATVEETNGNLHSPDSQSELSGSSLGLKSIEVMIRDGFRPEQGKGIREKDREVLTESGLPIRALQASPPGRAMQTVSIGNSSGQPSLTRVSSELGSKSCKSSFYPAAAG